MIVSCLAIRTVKDNVFVDQCVLKAKENACRAGASAGREEKQLRYVTHVLWAVVREFHTGWIAR